MHKENEPLASELGCLTRHLTHSPSLAAQLPSVPISMPAQFIQWHWPKNSQVFLDSSHSLTPIQEKILMPLPSKERVQLCLWASLLHPGSSCCPFLPGLLQSPLSCHLAPSDLFSTSSQGDPGKMKSGHAAPQLKTSEWKPESPPWSMGPVQMHSLSPMTTPHHRLLLLIQVHPHSPLCLGSSCFSALKTLP